MPEIGQTILHYKILEKIGEGGMGLIYKAEDTKLNRQVALKFLPEEISNIHQVLTRFKREARAASALNHPNICTVYDINESEGWTFITMELLEGQTLKEFISDRAPLQTDELIDLSTQIAEALNAAHSKNIIHRDLKPANIFITQSGMPKILDFGLAKLLDPDPELAATTFTAVESLTIPGSVIGTIAYMSPEQARGEKLDARSDLFSFGAALYEMATGRQAFSGNTAAVVSEAILNKAPASPVRLNPDLPNELERIINKLIEKDRRLRYQNALDLIADLRRLKRDGESGLKTEGAAQKTEGIQSLAVLPFVNMSGDKEQEYFSDGLAAEIINALTQLPGLRVTARTSSFYFRGKEGDIREIGAKLNVDNILEGSVRWAGKRIRVNAQLISVADGFHLWSERYDREPSDAFEIQDEICRKIVDKLQVELGTGRSLVKRYTENVDAYNLYLKGTYHLNRHTAANFEKAKEYYSQAVALDPNYSLAWVGLAFHYHYLGLFGYMQPKTANAKSSQATLKAIELDDSLAQAHAITAMLWANDFDWKGAEREFRRALELDPESFEVWGNYEYFYLIPMLQLDEAVAESKRALELDPLSAPMQWRLGHRYYLKREWDRAIEQFRNTLELDPHYAAAHFFLALADSQAGRLKPDISTIETVVRSGGRTPVSLQLLGWAYAVADNIIEAQDIIDELRELAQRTYVAPSSFAWIYMGLGDIEEAFEWFENAVDERDGFILHLPVDPVYDPLRSHPYYQDLLRKMNLEL